MTTDLTLNREFALRHFFVFLLMLVLGGWFGYDGFVAYPALSAHELYVRHHGGEAPASAEAARRHQASAIPRQKQFMTLCFIAAALIGCGLVRAWRFRFSFDDDGFVAAGVRRTYGDITAVDLRRWAKKGILVVRLRTGSVTLDGWHHTGVDAFYALLKKKGLLDACAPAASGGACR